MKKPVSHPDKIMAGILLLLTLLFWGRGLHAIITEYYSSNARWLDRFELTGSEAQLTGGVHIFIGFIVLSALLMVMKVERKIALGVMFLALLGSGVCFVLSLTT